MHGRLSWSGVIAVFALIIALVALVRPGWSPGRTPTPLPVARFTQGVSQAPEIKNAPLSENPGVIAQVAQDVAPSVVYVDVIHKENLAYVPWRDSNLHRFFGSGVPQSADPDEEVVQGNGSGVIIDPEGYILTNNHVVSKADEIYVVLQDERRYRARVIGADRYSDLAVLKINASHLKPAVLGDSDALKPGEWVVAIGNPFGFEHTVTAGIVSAISRWIPELNSHLEFIQTDAAINPGNSGGPLVNLQGQVVGINTAISGEGQNIGFAIPIETAKSVFKQLIAQGYVARPYFGVTLSELTPEVAQHLGLDAHTRGAVVVDVYPGSPAQKAGLHRGDVIVRVDGQPIQSVEQVQKQVMDKPIGTRFAVDVLRQNEVAHTAITTTQLDAHRS